MITLRIVTTKLNGKPLAKVETKSFDSFEEAQRHLRTYFQVSLALDYLIHGTFSFVKDNVEVERGVF